MELLIILLLYLLGIPNHMVITQNKVYSIDTILWPVVTLIFFTMAIYQTLKRK